MNTIVINACDYGLTSQPGGGDKNREALHRAITAAKVTGGATVRIDQGTYEFSGAPVGIVVSAAPECAESTLTIDGGGDAKLISPGEENLFEVTSSDEPGPIGSVVFQGLCLEGKLKAPDADQRL